MKKPKITVESVKVKRILDESPDTSFIGEYTNKWNKWAICRHCGQYIADYIPTDDNDYPVHNCPTSNREYNYFMPYAGGEKPGTDEYRKYGLQDFKRMERLNNGDWCFIGIVAECVVKYPIGSGNYRLEKFTSGGIWGIESDSDSTFIDEMTNEQLSDLERHLSTFGVNLENWAELVKDLELTD